MSDWEAALAQHSVYTASFDSAFWRDYLRSHPEVLHHILADLYQVTTGRDSAPNLDELWQLVAPRYSEKVFPEAFRDALGTRSIRQIALAAHMHHNTVLRFLNGQRSIVAVHDSVGSMDRLQVFSKALGVQPAYFLEWRRLWVMSVIDSAMGMHPNVSTSIYRRFSGQDRSSRTQTVGKGGRRGVAR